MFERYVSLYVKCLFSAYIVIEYELPYQKNNNLHIGKNKGADQLHSNCEADQHLCFRYTDSTVPLLPKLEILRF